mmetsp:Transcript_14418/g.32633  ORF Transcript_14418/g.32633 Transcript_14418/m.32633 type:complete len:98 (-) Transcript_14418:63-356(-)
MLWKGDLVDYDGSHCQAPPEGAQCLSSIQSAVIRDEESDLVCEDFHPQLLYPVPWGVKVLKRELQLYISSGDNLRRLFLRVHPQGVGWSSHHWLSSK